MATNRTCSYLISLSVYRIATIQSIQWQHCPSERETNSGWSATKINQQNFYLPQLRLKKKKTDHNQDSWWQRCIWHWQHEVSSFVLLISSHKLRHLNQSKYLTQTRRSINYTYTVSWIKPTSINWLPVNFKLINTWWFHKGYPKVTEDLRKKNNINPGLPWSAHTSPHHRCRIILLAPPPSTLDRMDMARSARRSPYPCLLKWK